jgi:hypothetical protein
VSECQVQRTLVKSPPELWETLSDPASLARHLGEFGEIRITRLEPETTVEWEAERASGTVHIAPSGWGTKVTLTATPATGAEPVPDPTASATTLVVWTAPQPFPPPQAPEPVSEAPPEPAPAADEPAAQESPSAETPVEDAPVFEQQLPAVAQAPASVAPLRRGWFQRLFGMKPIAEVQTDAPPPAPAPIELPVEPVPDTEPDLPDVEPPPAAEVPLATMEPDEATVEFAVASLWEPEAEATAEHTPEPEPAAEPAIDGERATAVLTSVLDDLGAAHHRPFSR